MNEDQKFDFNKFEMLTGLELGKFCLDKETLRLVDSSFLEYFKKNCDHMDDVHLASSLFLFERVHMQEAYPVVANYIDYPVTYVRMPALRFLTQWLNDYDIDESVLGNPEIINKVEKTLAEHSDLMGVVELKRIIKKNQKK